MANNTTLNPGTLGDTIATEDIAGVKHELVKVEFGSAGQVTMVDASNPLPVTDAQVVAKLSSDPSTETTLAAILAKIIASPATEATIASILAKLNASIAVTGSFFPATQPISLSSNINTVEVAPTVILNGRVVVTTAGTRTSIAASTPCKSVTVKAFMTNTGFIYIGNSTVTSLNGFRLSAGDTVSLDIADLNTVNIDSAVNGEGVTYIGIN
jgi:hypothetical protein